jgi:hypothetical protein
MTTIPADAPRSEDGQWWWDGAQWQPVDDPGAAAGAQSAAPAAGSEVNTSGVPYTGTAEIGEGTQVGTIDMSLAEIESILNAAGVDLGDSSGGGDLVAQQNPDQANA